MMAVQTQYGVGDLPEDRQALHRAIATAIPLSAGGRNASVLESAAPRIAGLETMADVEQAEDAAKSRLQIGSGNHFIEVIAKAQWGPAARRRNRRSL